MGQSLSLNCPPFLDDAKFSLPPIKRVAVIGAGAAGLPTARHLIDQGFDVTVFERNSAAGGVWNYDERVSPQPPFPSTVSVDVDPSSPPPKSQFPYTLRYKRDDVGKVIGSLTEIEHAPPSACYESLKNNVPTPLIKYKDFDWPANTKWYVRHEVIAKYLHDYAAHFGISQRTRYSTVVLRVKKEQVGEKKIWKVQTRTLIVSDDQFEVTWNEEEFDAVVVAAGHYHVPRVPDFPGLSEWHKKWPTEVIHSKAFREPSPFANENVLVVGGGASSIDILRALGPVADGLYQSIRGSHATPIRKAFAQLTPKRTVHLPNIKAFHPPPPEDGDNIRRGVVEFEDGTKITGLDRVVICTGYLFSYPFLDHLDTENVRRAAGSTEKKSDVSRPSTVSDFPTEKEVLTTDGEWVRNLYHDIFYIPDPTLAFIGNSFYIATFSFFEYQAIALSRVYAGKAFLPSSKALRHYFDDKLKKKGSGKDFHILGRDNEPVEVKELVDWVNRDGKQFGEPIVTGHDEEFFEVRAKSFDVYLNEILGSSPAAEPPSRD
ncbi:dimethylaniline monooxygenase [Cladochytrium replicatum]|nr:dimethylaniline monooxygenase [Cladochytrium replicatum]